MYAEASSPTNCRNESPARPAFYHGRDPQSCSFGRTLCLCGRRKRGHGPNEVAHDVKTFRFRPPDGGQIPFDYLPALHIAPQGIPTKRSYTIASTPTWRDRIEITVKREDHGLVSRWLHDELKIGSEVEIEAPNGTFFFTGKEADSIVLIGGGVGITPMMSVARYLTETTWPGKVHLILGFRGPRDFTFRTEVAALAARNSNLSVTVTMRTPGEEPWTGATGHINTDLLAFAVPDIASQRAHICGPPSMMEAVKAALVGLCVPETQLKTEAFGTVKRDPTAKGAASIEVAGKVVFRTSDTTAPVPVGATILDAADEAGVFIDNACRSGTCGSCRVIGRCEDGRRGCAHRRRQGRGLHPGAPGRNPGRHRS